MSSLFEQVSPTSLSVGAMGSVYIKGTTSNSGNWGCIYALTDVAFTALTSGVKQDGSSVMVPGSGIANLNGMTIPKGCAIFGYFTTVQLADAAYEVICYNIK